MFLYMGGYTNEPNGHAEGIGVYRFDSESGGIEHLQTVGDVANPSYMAIGPDGQTLYAVAESAGEGAVVAYARNPEDGSLRELNRQSSGGAGPCYVSIDGSGRYVLVANYNAGSISALPIGEGRRLEPASCTVQHVGSSVNPERQEGPHAHMIAPSPDGAFVFATDLGIDRTLGYRLDTESGQLIAVEGAGGISEPGAGPRHFAFSPDGRSVYVLNELGFTLTAYDYEAGTGHFAARQTVPTLPEEYHGWNLCAHVVVSPDGRFVYGSNRGHDSIAIWAVDEQNGELTFLYHSPSGGKTPRNFAIDPSGAWMLVGNMDSDDVVVFHRDAMTGMLTEAASHAIPSICCLVFAGG